MTKKRIVLLAALVCCAALLAGGTAAYFTAEEWAFNIITTGKVGMELHEETTGGEPFPEGGIHGVMPGESVDKKVYVENTGDVDVYVRIGVLTTTDPEGLPLDKITLDLDTVNWTEKDGWFYYNEALRPGEETPPLFTKVSFDELLPNNYMDARVEVKVHAQSVQSRNNSDSATTASGWPA